MLGKIPIAVILAGLALAYIIQEKSKHRADVEAALNTSTSQDGEICLYPIMPDRLFPSNCPTLREYNAITILEISTWSPEKRAQIEADVIREMRESGRSEAEISDFRARYERNVTIAP